MTKCFVEKMGSVSGLFERLGVTIPANGCMGKGGRLFGCLFFPCSLGPLITSRFNKKSRCTPGCKAPALFMLLIRDRQMVQQKGKLPLPGLWWAQVVRWANLRG